MEKLIRCYRYAIVPSSIQRLAIEKAAWTARKHRNAFRAPICRTRIHDTKPETSWVSLKFFRKGCWGAIFMSEPLGDRRKPLDNLLQNTVEEHNQQADEVLGVFQRDFPRTYRLLAGSRFQVPVRRQADYINYAHSIYGDAWMFIRATPCRAGRWGQGDRDAWRQVAREFTVVNEWLKQGQTTLFVERELGEVLKRTDLPEGFSPQDLLWRWKVKATNRGGSSYEAGAEKRHAGQKIGAELIAQTIPLTNGDARLSRWS